MFQFHCHGLWYLVYCWGSFCRFALVDSTIGLLCAHDLFLLVLYMLIPVFVVKLYPYFLAYVDVLPDISRFEAG